MMVSQRDRLLQIRDTFHLNQSQLAKRIGVTSQLISQMEAEKIPVSYLTARAIESEFGVSHEWLISGEGEMITKKHNAAKETELAPELTMALNYYPDIAEAINRIARRMTLPDWEALNAFVSRNMPAQSSECEEDQSPEEPEAGKE